MLLELQPGPADGKDSYVSLANPFTNYGASTAFVVYEPGSGGGPTFRSHIQFDISALPAGAVITAAVLSLYKIIVVGAPQAAQVLRITQAWDEATINWNNQPLYTSVIKDITLPDGIINQWHDIDVLIAVQNWHSGAWDNFGMVLKYVNELSGAAKGEYWNTSDEVVSPSTRPRLSITYNLPPLLSEYNIKQRPLILPLPKRLSGYNALLMVRGLFKSAQFAGALPVDAPLGEIPPSAPLNPYMSYDTVTKELTAYWGQPTVFDAGAHVRLWVKRSNGLVHRQVCMTSLAIGAFMTFNSYRGRSGLTIPVSTPGVYFFQMDCVNPNGTKSPPSEMMQLIIP